MRTRVLALVALGSAAAACSCGTKPAGPGAVKGTPPVVTITAPADGTHVKQGAATAITGTATDKEDGNITANLTWTDSQGEIPSTAKGGSISATFTKVGGHLVTATVTDKDGNKVSKSITINVDQAPQIPTVTIIRPQAGATFPIGQTVTFQATAIDYDGTDVSSTITWADSKSDFSGLAGATAKAAFSTSGAHTITATATGKNGTGSATVDVTVQGNHAPVLTVVTPAASYPYASGTITLTGTATDVEDGNLTSRIKWSVTDAANNVVGSGTGGTVGPITLASVGDYTVTASVTDNGFQTDPPATTTVTIVVHDVANLPPKCTIIRPDPANTFFTTDTITFQGACTDPDNPAGPNVLLASATLHWKDLSGTFAASGATVQSQISPAGKHTIQLCADDAEVTNPPAPQGCVTEDINVIQNTPPSCAISVPATGDTINAGAPYQTTFTATDAEDPSLTGKNLQYQWAISGVGAALRAGGVNASPMSVNITVPTTIGGAQTLTLTITDSGGLTCVQTVSVFVNRPPVTTITDAAQGGSTCIGTTTCKVGTAIDFTGTATDPDTGDTIATWTYTDNALGAFLAGSGSNVNASGSLPVGKHTVVLQATDGHGATSPVTAQNTKSFPVMPASGTFVIQTSSTDDYGNMVLGTNAAGTGPAIHYVHAEYRNQNPQDQHLHQVDLATSLSVQKALTGPTWDLALDAADGLLFVADDTGVEACPMPWDPATSTCTFYAKPAQNFGALEAVAYSGGFLFVGDDQGVVGIVGLGAGGTVPTGNGTIALAIRHDFGQAIAKLVAAATPGSVWVCTDGNGAFGLDSAGNPTRVDLGNGGSDKVWTAAVGVADTDLVYFGHANGITKYRISTQATSSFDPQNGGAQNSDVYAIAVDSGNPALTNSPGDVVWFGGNQTGLWRGDPGLGRNGLVRYTNADGLRDDYVYGLVVDANHRKWIGHATGQGGTAGLDYTDVP